MIFNAFYCFYVHNLQETGSKKGVQKHIHQIKPLHHIAALKLVWYGSKVILMGSIKIGFIDKQFYPSGPLQVV